MAEVDEESTRVWTHKARIALFLSAMRHFRAEMESIGWSVVYHALDDSGFSRLGDCLAADLRDLKPQQVRMVEPGEWRVREAIAGSCAAAGVALELSADDHFLLTLAEFETWAAPRRELRLEHFYRYMRKRSGILLDARGPAGGVWNFDSENRHSFGGSGPGYVPAPASFAPDRITRNVIHLVEQRFSGHPGSLAQFDWPVTAEHAKRALTDFIEHRLDRFGQWQDAMWTGAPVLYHSRLAAALNLKLISPRTVLDAAVDAYARKCAPIAAVEGFVRQILGWREYVRGIYWREMPAYLDRNELEATEPLPAFYWNARTDMACLREVIEQTLAYGYAHHIQRLMVAGLFALLLGVQPRRVHEWFLAVYVDAVEWVELPNTLGMSQFADGGILASKPYVATGRYIERMSNYCRGCRYDPRRARGANACPFTTLYWDFLARHETRFDRHPRMALQVRNLARLEPAERAAIGRRAAELRARFREAA